MRIAHEKRAGGDEAHGARRANGREQALTALHVDGDGVFTVVEAIKCLQAQHIAQTDYRLAPIQRRRDFSGPYADEYNPWFMQADLRILALETSGRLGSAALGTCGAGFHPLAAPLEDGCHPGVLSSAALTGDMRHAAELMPAVERLLQQQGWPARTLTDVFLSIGPGSFTGLRIGVTVARTLAWSVGARVVAVPTLDALALNALPADPRPPHVAVLLDAKRGQVYAAAYAVEGDACHRIIDATLEETRSFLDRCPRPLAVLGEGIDYHRPAVEASGATILDRSLWPGRAEHVFSIGLSMARSGSFTAGADLIPLYVRRPEAEERWEQLHPEAAREVNPPDAPGNG